MTSGPLDCDKNEVVFKNEAIEVQWLALCALTARAQVQSLVGELRPCKACGMPKQNNNKRIKLLFWYKSENVFQDVIAHIHGCPQHLIAQLGAYQ